MDLSSPTPHSRLAHVELDKGRPYYGLSPGREQYASRDLICLLGCAATPQRLSEPGCAGTGARRCQSTTGLQRAAQRLGCTGDAASTLHRAAPCSTSSPKNSEHGVCNPRTTTMTRRWEPLESRRTVGVSMSCEPHGGQGQRLHGRDGRVAWHTASPAIACQ